MRIEKYNASRLKNFLDSELYRELPFVPVSLHRAQSWLNNPRLKPDDILLYLGFEGEDMIAYRSVLPDRHRDIRFAWLSGNWVRPDYRRKGLASKLFEEAYSDWGHQLMYTNYAPESKAVYDKTGRFEIYREKHGMRYYQRSKMAEILGNRKTLYKRSRPLLSLSDGMLNAVQYVRISLQRDSIEDLSYEVKSNIDFMGYDFLEENHGRGFSLRGLEEFNWITSYPWIIDGTEKDNRYFFSSVSRKFKNICISVRDEDEGIKAILWIVIIGDKMSLPYIVFKPDASEDVSRILNHYMQNHHIASFTTYQSSVIDIFRPGPILHSRRMIQNYYATRDLIKQLPAPDSIFFMDGDGDVVFV